MAEQYGLTKKWDFAGQQSLLGWSFSSPITTAFQPVNSASRGALRLTCSPPSGLAASMSIANALESIGDQQTIYICYRVVSAETLKAQSQYSSLISGYMPEVSPSDEWVVSSWSAGRGFWGAPSSSLLLRPLIATLPPTMGTPRPTVDILWVGIGNAKKVGKYAITLEDLQEGVNQNAGNIQQNTSDIYDHDQVITSVKAEIEDPVTGLVATAGGLNILEGTVSNQGGVISANSTALTTVRADLGNVPPGYGSFSQAVDYLSAESTAHGNDISANAAAITSVRGAVQPVFDAGKTWDFGAATTTLGWYGLNGATLSKLASNATYKGAVRYTAGAAADNYIVAPVTGVTKPDAIYMRLRNNSVSNWQNEVYIQTSAGYILHGNPEGGWPPVDGEFHTLVFPITNSSILNGSRDPILLRFDGPSINGQSCDILWISLGRASVPAAYAEADRGLQTQITTHDGRISSNSSSVTSVKAALAGTGKPSSYYATATSGLYAAVTKGGTGNPDDFIQVASMWTVKLDANGYATAITYANDGTTATWKMDADSFVIKSSHGVYQLEWEKGVLSTKAGSIYTRVGAGFGSFGDLVFYSGTSATPNGSSLNNAKVAIDSSGRTKFAGALTSAGGAYSGTVTASVNGSSATISVSAGVFKWGDTTTSYNGGSATVSGSAGQTKTYYVSASDPGRTGGSKMIYASTSPSSFAGVNTVSFGVVTIRFGSPGNPGGSAGGGSCVTTDTRLPTGRAGDVAVGDLLDVAEPVTLRRRHGRVSYSKPITVPCVRVTTGRGVVLECSESAPIPDTRGRLHPASTLLDKELWALIGATWMRDRVTKVEHIGYKQVQHITCENACFLAGNKAGYILHHNLKPPPPILP